MHRSVFLTVDGASVQLDAPGFDLSQPWYGNVLIRVLGSYHSTTSGLVDRQFGLGPRGNHLKVLQNVLGGTVALEVDSQGGRLVVGHGGPESEQGIAYWRGPWHELSTFLPEPQMAPAKALEYFDGLLFTDTPDGLLVESAKSFAESVEATHVNKHIPGVGFMEIVRSEYSLDSVPKWAGMETPSGELWRERAVEGETGDVLVHMTPTTVARLSPEPGVIDARRLAFLGTMVNLSWSRPDNR